jgi:uncharacterized membrane protein
MAKEEKETSEPLKDQVKRIGGYLHRIVPVVDKSGEVLSYALKPLMVEFKPRDVFQVIVGSSLIAIPVAMSEEAWTLAESLPMKNIIYLSILSLVFIGSFGYFNFYRFQLKGNVWEFVKRTLGTYIISAVMVTLFLTVIQKCPWGIDNMLALKRILLVSFPAGMSGTLSDTIK